MIGLYDEKQFNDASLLMMPILLNSFRKKDVLLNEFMRERAKNPNLSDLQLINEIWSRQRKAILEFTGVVSTLAKDKMVISSAVFDLFKEANEIALMDLKKWMSHYKVSRIGVHYPKIQKSKKRRPSVTAGRAEGFGRIDLAVLSGPKISKTETIDEFLARGGKISRKKNGTCSRVCKPTAKTVVQDSKSSVG